jgi:poly(beta-D-mannuronate) lyase
MYCSVTNCAIIDYTPTEASQKNNNYVEIKGTHNELDHCYFKGKINKGPTVTIRYFDGDDYVKGSDNAPSTYHHIHHNYFGYRTYSENGGEQIRVGVSATSNTKGFNVIEYNYFEDTRIEAEVVSNKSCYNIYRFNNFHNNDGALVLRHGTHCLVYGNYINGKSGREKSGGIRVVNAYQTVFNNYIENIEGGATSPMKGPLVLMSGITGAELSDYNPADFAMVAHNTVINSSGNPVKLSIGNTSKSSTFIAPKNVEIIGNLILNFNPSEREDAVLLNIDAAATYQCDQNITNYSNSNELGFKHISADTIIQKNNLYENPVEISLSTLNKLKDRLKVFGLELTKEEMTHFNRDWILSKKDVGVNWNIE